MKTKIILLSICFSVPALFSCNGQKGKSSVSMKTQADSVAYCIGVSIGTNMKKDELDKLNIDLLIKGMKESLKGDSTAIDNTTGITIIQAYLGERQREKGEAAKEDGRKFLAENKKKPGVKITASGLQYIVIQEGTGSMPAATDTIIVHYHGTLTDGTIFDSTVERGQPAEYPVNGFIPGMTEALLLMKEGTKLKVFIPSELAYGERQMGPKIKPHSVLVFDLELLKIKG